MTLGLNTGSSGQDFLPICIYDARAGRMFKQERQQTATGWESSRIDISSPPPVFAVDMGSIEVGWLAFPATGPDFRMAPLGSPLPPQPSKEHRQGFRVKIVGKVIDGLRVFSHQAKCVLAAMDDLHIRYESAPEAAQGKIPVVRLAGTMPVETKGPQGKTTNYAPVFEIVQWTDRTPEMGERTVAAPGHRTVTAPMPSNHVPPPAPAAPALATTGSDLPPWQ